MYYLERHKAQVKLYSKRSVTPGFPKVIICAGVIWLSPFKSYSAMYGNYFLCHTEIVKLFLESSEHQLGERLMFYNSLEQRTKLPNANSSTIEHSCSRIMSQHKEYFQCRVIQIFYENLRIWVKGTFPLIVKNELNKIFIE